jgi:hypothetical protein
LYFSSDLSFSGKGWATSSLIRVYSCGSTPSPAALRKKLILSLRSCFSLSSSHSSFPHSALALLSPSEFSSCCSFVAYTPVMIGTRLTIKRGPNSVTFPEFHFSKIFEGTILPAHEGIVVGVHIGGDEGSSPIHSKPHQFGVALQK